MKPELVIDEMGNRRWYLNGELHRTNGPAVEYVNFAYVWYSNGERHRTDGPAVEYANGSREWFLHDNQYPFAKWLELTPLTEYQKLLLVIEYGEHV